MNTGGKAKVYIKRSDVLAILLEMKIINTLESSQRTLSKFTNIINSRKGYTPEEIASKHGLITSNTFEEEPSNE